MKETKLRLSPKTALENLRFLKILLGKEIADSGEVVINKDVQVVLFDQEIEFESQLICGRIHDDTRF